MSSTMFQKYLEGMNGQSLVKRPQYQGSGVLLPHQRTGPIKKTITNQESVIQTPNNTRNGQVGHVIRHKDVPVLVSNTQINTESRRSKDLSPEHNRGLSASRWNDQSYQGTPTPPRHTQKQQRETVETQFATPARKRVDKNTHWAPVQKPISLAGNGAEAQRSGLNASDTQNDNTWPVRWDEVKEVTTNRWKESEDVGNRIWDSGYQSSAATPIAAATKTDLEATKMTSFSPQVEVQWLGKPGRNDITPDPRGTWPAELGIQDQVKQDMADQDRESLNETEEIQSSTEEEVIIPQHATNFIETWVLDAHVVTTNFLSQNIDHHEDCDVDTLNGVLLSPVEYPRTSHEGSMSRNQAKMTAAILTKQFLAEIARKRKAQQKPEKYVKVAARDSEEEIGSAVAELPNPNEVQIPCHLRPATESDIPIITAIYNREISDGYKVMDTKPISSDEFHEIYHQCLTEKMPFVVAVEGCHGVIDTSHQRILGFSLVTAVHRGISGSYETLSNRGGKLLVIVQPECRRKKVGTALIDIIMTNCTGWYISKGGYQFINFTHDWISKEFGSNPRKWWYLEMEVMILSGDNEEKTRQSKEFKWIWDFLEAKFDMILKHYDEKCLYQPRQMNWLDKLTFRRICRTLGE
ncbi:hypothetical protein F4859DRAFT_521308 [Xylaria cf. heliscus]|nr:hypothetical protein F4859DRAFT_521308 [Xylaria cf. heliscus]